MRVIHGINRIKKFKNPVVALGVFDGVHLGHRHILKAAAKKARDINGTSIFITFHPHPQGKDSLYSLNHRLRLIAELGIDVCAVIRFDARFAWMSAEDFIKNILVDKIGAKFIFVGNNFRFGRGAGGDTNLLKRLSVFYNYIVHTFGVISSRGQPISSTYLRKLITHGKIRLAENLLHYPVTVLGTVIKGISLAQKIGFPTANIDPHHEILPPSGVYAVKAILNNKIFRGVCNIGVKPTIFHRQATMPKGQKSDKHVEVYILDFNKNIYGKDLEVQFIKKIRDEKKFASLSLLASRIKKDISRAKMVFSRH